ncbi:MAG: hypothetical protein ACREBQ_09105, partial [Nitrososphaerales archaeon]
KYPDFQFPERSRGAIAHRDEISLYLSELSKLGFNLKKSVEDSNLADINQMSRHLPESFRIEVKREFPRIPDLLLKRVVGVSVKEVLNKYQGFEDSRVATEVFSVFERA